MEKKKSGTYLFVLSVCVFASMYECVPHACSTCEGQKKALKPLGLELLVGISHVGSGAWKLNHSPLQEQPVLLTKDLT